MKSTRGSQVTLAELSEKIQGWTSTKLMGKSQILGPYLQPFLKYSPLKFNLIFMFFRKCIFVQFCTLITSEVWNWVSRANFSHRTFKLIELFNIQFLASTFMIFAKKFHFSDQYLKMLTLIHLSEIFIIYSYISQHNLTNIFVSWKSNYFRDH